MRKNQLHNMDVLKDKRKELRNNLTPAEAFLWKKLQRSQLCGRKFRRQHSIGPYVLDFYCSTEKLGIELDGLAHFNVEAAIKDKKRTEYLIEMGIDVIRFENWQVFECTEEVLAEIKKKFKSDHPLIPS